MNNQLQLRPLPHRPDTEIASQLIATLRDDVYINEGPIDVKVWKGQVILSGAVGSATEKRRVITKAWLTGADGVDATQLVVTSLVDDPNQRETPVSARSPSEIRQAVERALAVEPRVNVFDVQTYVSANGVVTLRGRATDLKAKRAAAQAARSTVGDNRVINRIKVRAINELSNAEITAQAKQALQRDPYLADDVLSVFILSGTAYLYGEVDSSFEKARAEDVAARANGVSDIENYLQVNQARPLAYKPYDADWNPAN